MKKIILVFNIIIFICFSATAQKEGGTTTNWNTSVSITEQNLPEVKIYPNPCKDNKVTVELNNHELSEIEITNIAGKQMYYEKLTIPESKKQIQLQNFPDGLYIIQIKTNENKLIAKKLLVASN